MGIDIFALVLILYLSSLGDLLENTSVFRVEGQRMKRDQKEKDPIGAVFICYIHQSRQRFSSGSGN